MVGIARRSTAAWGHRHRAISAALTAVLASSLFVTPVLAADPVANDQNLSQRQDLPLDIFLDAFDDDFDPLSYVVTDPPNNGSLSGDCADDGFCTYTPDPGFVGADAFMWKANDGGADSNVATVTIDIFANNAPVANDQSENVFVDEPEFLYFDAFDDDYDDLTLAVVTGPGDGTLTDCSGLWCLYTPDPGFVGPDTVVWKANDGLADSNTATMTITVAPPQCAYAPGVCIDQGTIQLGVNPEGHLNVQGDIESSGGTLPVGLRFLDTGAEATAPGCLCEGWGAADATSGTTGYANVSTDNGVNGMALESFTSTASTAVSTVNIGNTLRVTHDFHPSPNANLYEVEVTIENISAATIDARYRRVMDWDVEPTAFDEYVTIETGGSTALLFSSDDGFATANPLGGPASIDFTGEAVDSGPNDHGALFDFGFGNLDPGQSTTFRIYYGAAATEAGALAAITQIHGEVWSLGQPSTEDGPTLGTPNTFIFAFGGVGGDPLNNDPVADDDTATTPQGVAVDIDVLDGDTDADPFDTLTVASVTDPANGTTTINPDGTVQYTPDPGFVGEDTFDYTVSDGHGGTDTATVVVTVTAVTNPAPTSNAGDDKNGTEGSAISLDGTVTNEPAGDTLTTTWSYALGAGTDAGMTCSFGNAANVDTTITCTDDGTVTVKLTADDGVNPPVDDTATLTIANADPTVSITSPADTSGANVGATVNLTASRGDPGTNDTHTCSIDWGDGTVTTGTLTATTCTGSHQYAVIGVPTIRVTITDDDGGDATDEIMLVVSAPGSKVTGGGWISDAGGKLRFGLVAQGSEGEIQVRWAGHRFHGKTVSGLAVAKPQASWSGTGRYDGTTGYTYEVTVRDNGNGGGKHKTPDTFAIVIRDGGGAVVFSTSGPLGGGNLKIH